MKGLPRRAAGTWPRRAVACGLVLLFAGCSPGGAERPTYPAASPSSGNHPSGGSVGAPAGLDRFYGQVPEWDGCGGGFECARIDVPLDHAQPGGETIELSVVRRPARGGDRVGSLVLNPGGPGVSGIGYARAADVVVSDRLRDRFDIVGFDPRGVGESTAVDCFDDDETDTFVAADGSPDNAREEAGIVHLSELLGRRCAERNGRLLAHLSTRDAARDIDVLRAVLGDEKLHYLGKSYGTFLGATYAGLFPERVGTMVLDGAIDPAATSTEVSRAQAVGFERALRAFVDDCLRLSSCPLPGPRDAALVAVQRLLEGIDRRPLPGEEGRPLTEGLAVLGLAYALYDEGSWPVLRRALGAARDGDGSLLLLLADAYTDREPDGRYRSNLNDAFFAVSCLDRPEDGAVDAARARAADLARVAPRFGAYLAWSSLPCASWPYQPRTRPHPVRAAGSAPILVVGTTRDPATPYEWAEALARQLASGRLLTYVGDGHTAYRHGSTCVDEAVDEYLVHGRLPVEGTRCR